MSYPSETAHIPLSLPDVSTLQLPPLAYIPSKCPTRQCSTPTSLVGALRLQLLTLNEICHPEGEPCNIVVRMVWLVGELLLVCVGWMKLINYCLGLV